MGRVSASTPHDVWRRLRRDRAAMAGAACTVLLVLGAVLAPVITPYDPTKITMRERLQTPSARHWLGTDQFGRDILSRIVHGTRVSLTVGLIAVGIGAVPGFTRLTRSEVLSIREREYVEAARALGARQARILVRYVLPNALSSTIVLGTLALATAILSAAILSFLGLGARPPMPEWGAMAAEGRGFIAQYPHIATFPSLAIFVVVLCFNLLGDGLRDALDPRLTE